MIWTLKLDLPQTFESGVETEFAMQVIERARLKLGNHEHFIGNRKLGDVDSIGSGLHKSVAGIICRMAEQKNKWIAMRETPPFAFFNQFPADPLSLIIRKHGQGP